MEIKNFISSKLDENIYLIFNDKKECAIIDPGEMEDDKLIDYIKENNLDLKYIFLTHGHFDHILGLEKVLSYKNIPIYMGEEDIKFLYDSHYSLSHWVGIDYKLDEKYKITPVNDNQKIFGLKVMKTPGHTEGSVCYINEEDKVIFTGDTLFKMAYGRTDFPTGDYKTLLESLNKIFKLDENMQILSGHGIKTNIKNEKITYDSMFY